MSLSIGSKVISGTLGLVSRPIRGMGAMLGKARVAIETAISPSLEAVVKKTFGQKAEQAIAAYRDPTTACSQFLSPRIPQIRDKIITNSENPRLCRFFLKYYTGKRHVQSTTGVVLLSLTNVMQCKTKNQSGNPKELSEIKRAVHENICSILKSKRENSKLFTLDHFVALMCFIAVKYFNLDADDIDNFYKELLDEAKEIPELVNELKACGELFFLKLLQEITANFLEERQFTSEEIDDQWKKLMVASEPFIGQIISSQADQVNNPIVSKAIKIAIKLLGPPTSVLSNIQPSKIIEANC